VLAQRTATAERFIIRVRTYNQNVAHIVTSKPLSDRQGTNPKYAPC
jgi:hypothetical protein